MPQHSFHNEPFSVAQSGFDGFRSPAHVMMDSSDHFFSSGGAGREVFSVNPFPHSLPPLARSSPHLGGLLNQLTTSPSQNPGSTVGMERLESSLFPAANLIGLP